MLADEKHFNNINLVFKCYYYYYYCCIAITTNIIFIFNSDRLCFEKAKEMSGKNWVVLVAGSKDWENYQHQVCPFIVIFFIFKTYFSRCAVPQFVYDDSNM